jgi:pyridoxine 5-phosphate synthase
MPVHIRSEASGRHSIDLPRLRRSAEVLLKATGQQRSELSILLVDDPAMRVLNHQYRHKDKPTNVLSFPMQEGTEIADGSLLGDIVISVDTAAREAESMTTPLRQRLNWLLIHGLIHLLGYDHERSETEAILMEFRERELQNHLLRTERKNTMTQLAINVDHVATLRQARGINEPDPVLAAGICELAGASGIVVHLREDRRHIQDRDVRILRETVKTRLNLEMGATPEIISIALDVKPDMITLVPEKRQELTTEGGLNVSGQKKKLAAVIAQMEKSGIPVSLFIDPDPKQIKTAAEIGAAFVEIHTGRYCDATTETMREHEFELVAAAANEAFALGLTVNAGHGLNYQNVSRVAALDAIHELSIGHSVMARAIMVGMDQAVREMLALVRGNS